MSQKSPILKSTVKSLPFHLYFKETHFKKELKKAHGSSLYRKMELKSGVRFQDELNSGKPYTTLQFHLLTYEAKNYYFHHSSMLYLQLEKNLRKTVNYIDLNQTE